MNTELPEAFDPTAQKGSEFSLIPTGEYTAQIIEARVAPPSTGDGYMLTLVGRSRREITKTARFGRTSPSALERAGGRNWSPHVDGLAMPSISARPSRTRVSSCSSWRGSA
jgi:hypothetical protein